MHPETGNKRKRIKHKDRYYLHNIAEQYRHLKKTPQRHETL